MNLFTSTSDSALLKLIDRQDELNKTILDLTMKLERATAFNQMVDQCNVTCKILDYKMEAELSGKRPSKLWLSEDDHIRILKSDGKRINTLFGLRVHMSQGKTRVE